MHFVMVVLLSLLFLFWLAGAVIVWSLCRVSSLASRFEGRISASVSNLPPSASAPVCGIGGNAHQRRIIRRSRVRAKELAAV